MANNQINGKGLRIASESTMVAGLALACAVLLGAFEPDYACSIAASHASDVALYTAITLIVTDILGHVYARCTAKASAATQHDQHLPEQA